MSVVALKTPAETALAAHFSPDHALPGAAQAFARVQKTGLPSKRVEAYHYTDARAALRELAPLARAQAQPAPLAAPALAGVPPLLDFINGHCQAPAASALPEGVRVTPLTQALALGGVSLGVAMGAAVDPLVDLNAVLAQEGVLIEITRSLAEPLSLRFIAALDTPHMIAPRVVICVGAQVAATVIETHHGPDGVAYQQNSVVEAHLAEGARLHLMRLNEAGDAACVFSTLAADLAENAALEALNVTFGGVLSRHSVFARFSGEGASVTLNGASLLRGEQHADNTLVVDHAVPHGVSRELFRSVVDGAAQGVFQGKIIVRPGAQKTDGQMASNALLLSDEAGMANKPELEIFADDVVCAHGATCGALDDAQLFYLMARGLPRVEAEALLIEAFMGEALDLVTHEGVRAALGERVADWLKNRTI